jgi:methionyl-tRNA synthetase
MPYEVHGFSMTEEIEGMSIDQYITTVVLPEYKKALDGFEISTATAVVWNLISFLDRVIARTEPFKLIKTDKEKAEAILFDLLSGLYTIADLLEPIMPVTAETLHEHIGRYDSNRPEAFVVKKFETPLFPRKV